MLTKEEKAEKAIVASIGGIGLATVLMVIAMFSFIALMLSANFWYGEAGVEKELRQDHPNITKVVKWERNMVSPSIIKVIEGNKRVRYCLDTNILGNYTFKPCD